MSVLAQTIPGRIGHSRAIRRRITDRNRINPTIARNPVRIVRSSHQREPIVPRLLSRTTGPI
jgi:hypothetical protein